MLKIKFGNKELVNVLFNVDVNELGRVSELKIFNNEAGTIYSHLNLNNEGLIYVGTKGSEHLLLNLRMSGFKLGKELLSRKIVTVSLETNNLSDLELKSILEGLVDSLYNFDYYKVNKKELALKSVVFVNEMRNGLINEVFNIMDGVFITRDLVNLRANDIYPESYAKKIVDLFKDSEVIVEVSDEKVIQELGMHALLEVARGSDRPPRFVVLKYLPNKNVDHLTIVGKGVTYDSGGYAIKPASSMASMNSDMAGSAAVVGLFKTLSNSKLKVNVVGVIALTENLINGSAYKNGDVIQTMKGTTVEIVNTDAEGRLTLADAIYYSATRLKSHTILEASTLTGAAVNALGSYITAITTKEDELYNKIHEIGNLVGEENWRMPMTKPLRDSVKSDVAELKNAVVGGGGMMTAGIFLEHFAEDIPFLHFDIAGTSYGSGIDHLPKGASGVLVKTLYEYIKSM